LEYTNFQCNDYVALYAYRRASCLFSFILRLRGVLSLTLAHLYYQLDDKDLIVLRVNIFTLINTVLLIKENLIRPFLKVNIANRGVPEMPASKMFRGP
jgi:hypothetical protein